MKHCLFCRIGRAAIVVIACAILIGCTASVAPSQPTVSPTEATLTVLEAPVQVSRANSAAAALKQDDTVTIGVNDEIVVPESGRGELHLGNRLMVTILRGTKFSLSDVKLEPGDGFFAILRQISGHSRVALDDNANTRARLETDFGSITTLKPGTEFTVCHDPALLTCLVVDKGEVEVVAQGTVARYKAGEGTYILKDQAPFPPICVHPDEVDAWLTKKLGTGEVQALGELVASWKQEPCSAATAEASAPAQPVPQALPSSQGMVRVEAGTYTVGSPTSDGFHIPQLQKKLPAFWIDIYEVTNAQYKAFLDQTGHRQPASWPGKEKHPVAGVTWDDAVAYCTWANKRLPTEAEWEVAGRGPGPNPPLYPWGIDPDAGGKAEGLPRTETYEVGSMAFNKSSLGVYDMAGNVWEWVGDPYYPVAEGMKIVRGGRYGLVLDMAYRQPAEPQGGRFIAFTGFRCASERVQGE